MANPPDDNSPSKKELARWSVEELFKGAREVILVHNDEDYRLRVTSSGKLILTK